MRRIDLVQGTAEWHEYRRTHANASEAACILGCAKYQPDTWLKLYRLKTGQIEPTEPTAAMRRGIEREPITRRKVIDATGIVFEPCVIEEGFLSASLDGLSVNTSASTTLEIKNTAPDSETWKAALREEIEPHYRAQVQHGLWLSGAERCLFAVDSGSDTRIIWEEPDKSMFELLNIQWSKFWSHIQEFSPPEPTERDIIAMTGHEWAIAAAKYRAGVRLLEEAERSVKSAKDELARIAGNQTCQGLGLRVQTKYRKGALDYSKIPELDGVNLERYRRSGINYVEVREIKG